MKDIDITNFEIQVSYILINWNYTNNKSIVSSIRYAANIRTTMTEEFNVYTCLGDYLHDYFLFYMITNLTSHEHMCYKTNFEKISLLSESNFKHYKLCREKMKYSIKCLTKSNVTAFIFFNVENWCEIPRRYFDKLFNLISI